MQLSNAAQATATAVTQPTVTSPTTQTVVPQATLATAAPNQLAMANGNIVMVRNPTEVRTH